MNDALHQYAKLSPWKPDQLAGWRVGDLADLPGLGRVEVTALLPPSLLQVRAASGALVKIGIYAAKKVQTAGPPTNPGRTRHRQGTSAENEPTKPAQCHMHRGRKR